ncbi:hypothetical protein CWATWH0003_5449 [Crocosphaera watsonii WH 0003]|uniref:Uncharacterized protein n=1 Tax=Crocosphaera watsonii WH 0003 TaxID=423471 RepID=G5JDF6_CROWT|nr:hypothetical protein CWATWH0003_5449 [Crocosphaera watsonii WH 0003]
MTLNDKIKDTMAPVRPIQGKCKSKPIPITPTAVKSSQELEDLTS